MQDNFGFPLNTNADVQIFKCNCPSTVTTTPVYQWTEWKKPRGKTMVAMWALGAGGGGGCGATATAGTAAAGGGGGGTGAVARCIFPAQLVPSVLYIAVGAGGLGNVTPGAGAGEQVGLVIFPMADGL